MIEAIPSWYNGKKFRSRLEAHWARLFDALGWDWQYEPEINFPKVPLGRWLPDFRILTYRLAPVLVEVKPVEWIGDLATHIDVRRAAQNADAIGLKLLAIGPRPFGHADPLLVNRADPHVLGLFVESTGYFEPALIGVTAGLHRIVDSCLTDCPKRGVPSQIVQGSSNYFGSDEIPGSRIFERIWNDCKNAGQWKPKP